MNPGASGLANVADTARHELTSAGGAQWLAVTGAAGGLLALLVGGKRKNQCRLGGVVSRGGAAFFGMLANQAYRSWRNGQSPAQAPGGHAAGLPRDWG